MQQAVTPPRDKDSPEKLFAMMCMFAAAFMQQLDSTIVNVALPHMQGSLQASREQITWVLTSYIVATALMTAPAASISARIGRKTLFQICVAGFTIASVLCGVAQSLSQIVIFRFLQGAAGAGLMPVVLAILLDNYEGNARSRMLAVFSLMANFGMIAGPALGGYITDVAGWRWTFLINVPMGLFMLLGVGLFFHDSSDKRQVIPFDVFGFATLSVAVAAFQLMLDRGPTMDWFGSSEVIAEASIAAIAFYLFAVHMMTAKIRFIPPALFRDRNFIIGTTQSTLNISLAIASAALLPSYLQTLGNYSVLETGLVLSPRGVGAVIGAIGGARLFEITDRRVILLIGWAFAAWSLWEMAHWTPDVGATSLVLVSLAQGIAMAGLGAVNNVVSFSTLPKELSNDGTGVNMLLRNVGSAILISVSATLIAHSAQTMHEVIGSFASPFNRLLSQGAPALFWNPATPFGARQIGTVISHNASMIAYANVFLFLFYVSCLVPILTFMLRIPPRAGAANAAHIPVE